VARRMIVYFQQTKATAAKSVVGATLAPETSTLTARETEVLGKLAEGVSVKEVSSILGISWETVRNHITNIYEKLHVHSRTEAVLKYLGRTTTGTV
jgi:DNA-binding NarL/FixJ family response regulator